MGKLIVILALLFSSCATENMRRKICANCPTRDTIWYIERITIKKDSFYFPADSAFYYALLVCRNGKVEIDKILAQINGNRTKATVSIENNRLVVKCHNDSLMQIIDRLQKEIKSNKSSTKIIEVAAPIKEPRTNRLKEIALGWFWILLTTIIAFLALVHIYKKAKAPS